MTSDTGGAPTPTRGVPVLLDRERRLRYSFRTMRELRDAFGGKEIKDLAGSAGGFQLEDIAKAIWYGLKHEDSALTIEMVEELLDLENLNAVVDALFKALGYKRAPKVSFTEEEVPRREIAPGGPLVEPAPAPAVAPLESEAPAAPAPDGEAVAG